MLLSGVPVIKHGASLHPSEHKAALLNLSQCDTESINCLDFKINIWDIKLAPNHIIKTL